MKAGKDKVISLHYTLTVDGEKVESSHDRDEALWVLLGHGQLIPGLETALEGHEAGALWTRYLANWTVWNHVRTVTSLAAAALLTVGLYVSAR